MTTRINEFNIQDEALAAIAALAANSVTIADLSDVDLTTSPTDGQALVYDTATSKWMPGSVASGGGGGGASSANTRVYTGTGAQTVFGVTSGQTIHSILVLENGVLQLPNTDYTVAGSNLVFTTAPDNGVVIQVRELPSGGGSSGANAAAAVGYSMVFGG